MPFSTIPTDKGDLVLDNRRPEILLWNQSGYTFLKRQSQPQSNQWVSLQKGQLQRGHPGHHQRERTISAEEETV